MSVIRALLVMSVFPLGWRASYAADSPFAPMGNACNRTAVGEVAPKDC